MPNPTSVRKKEILSKLDYASHKHKELMNELYTAKDEGQDPEFLVHTTADIISTVRECFDYLAQDIFECYILPNTENKKILEDYKSGKLKIYFPYYISQIAKTNSTFGELKVIEPALYDLLKEFTSSVESNSRIPHTNVPYKTLVDVKDMVNEKKHDKLIGIVSNNDREYLIQNEDLKIIIPMSEQSGWSSFSVTAGSKVSKVQEYRFEYNNKEVGLFCLYAITGTKQVIMNFYEKHFVKE